MKTEALGTSQKKGWIRLAVVVALLPAALPFSPRVARAAARRGTVRAVFSGIVEEMGSVRSLVESDAMPLWDGSVGKGVELTVGGAHLDTCVRCCVTNREPEFTRVMTLWLNNGAQSHGMRGDERGALTC